MFNHSKVSYAYLPRLMSWQNKAIVSYFWEENKFSSDNDEHVNKAKNVNKDSPMETEYPSWMGHPVEIKFNFTLTTTTTTTTTRSYKKNVLYCRNNK